MVVPDPPFKCGPPTQSYLKILLTHYTARIMEWGDRVLGRKLFCDKWERVMRVAEEAIELAQCHGASKNDIFKLADRVYDRPPGEPSQEVAGVFVTLLAYCSDIAHSSPSSPPVDIVMALDTEVNRIENIDPAKVRAKQSDKAKHELGLYPTFVTEAISDAFDRAEKAVKEESARLTEQLANFRCYASLTEALDKPCPHGCYHKCDVAISIQQDLARRAGEPDAI